MSSEGARGALERLRAIIHEEVPGVEEHIKYGIPTFKLNGFLASIAAFKNHCSLFPMGSSVIVAFKEELKGFETAKGTIRFPVDKPPAATLIKKLVKARIAQNEAKSGLTPNGATLKRAREASQ